MAADHPDSAQVDRVSAALRAWLEVAVGTPTSQLTGGGAVGHVEHILGELHDGRPALLVPSATAGLLGLLTAMGVGRGDEVLIPVLDWPSTLAAVRAVGATPIPVPVSSATWTIDPEAAAARVTSRTRVAVACHLLGIPADVPALRSALPGVLVIEDCAQALGSTLDGELVGTLGDAAVFSFGPGKVLDAGEAGAVIVRDSELRDAVLRQAAHPIRQRHAGIENVGLAGLIMRVHPLAAMLLGAGMARFDPRALRGEHAGLAATLSASTGLAPMGAGDRRGMATTTVAVDALDLEQARLPVGLARTYGEVLDIGTLAAGTATARRIGFVRSQTTSMERR